MRLAGSFIRRTSVIGATGTSPTRMEGLAGDGRVTVGNFGRFKRGRRRRSNVRKIPREMPWVPPSDYMVEPVPTIPWLWWQSPVPTTPFEPELVPEAVF
jgi:hypothetical protein